MIEIIPTSNLNMPKIMVIGIGGAGGNAVNRMYTDQSAHNHMDHVQYAVVNTDLQALASSPVSTTVQLGVKLTQGFGAGADSAVGEAAATESIDQISELTQNINMVILTCGLGGGTGSGAIPVIAKNCKDHGILTVAVVTTPFSFEGRPRNQTANTALEKLKENVDTLLVIPNDKLLTLPGTTTKGKSFCLEDAFTVADSVLKDTVFSITNIIYNSGLINLDFNDVCTVLQNKGLGHIGIGYSDDKKPLTEAMQEAIQSPLLDTNITGASNILLNTSGRQINLAELNDAIQYVRQVAGDGVNIIWGTVNDEYQPDKVIITLIATGMKNENNFSETVALPTFTSFMPTKPSVIESEPNTPPITPPVTTRKAPSQTPTLDIRPIQSHPKEGSHRYQNASNGHVSATREIPYEFEIPSFLSRFRKSNL